MRGMGPWPGYRPPGYCPPGYCPGSWPNAVSTETSRSGIQRSIFIYDAAPGYQVNRLISGDRCAGHAPMTEFRAEGLFREESDVRRGGLRIPGRSEEHTSELQ